MTPSTAIELPDPFLRTDGQRLKKPDEWPSQRPVLLAPLLSLQYGHLPAAPQSPAGTGVQLLHSAAIKHMGGVHLLSVRIHSALGQVGSFCMQLWVPQGVGPFPVVLTGDACWHYATDAVIAHVLQRGYCFAQFNRVELAADVAGQGAITGHAAIATWAWGYHRCVDALQTMQMVRKDQIAVVGHSRGGKAALLAGATDERIALTSANNSGTGGAGSYRWQSAGSESLADIVQAFSHWFSPRLDDFAGKENTLPFDQHFLTALIAPRALHITQSLDDHWANPEGTWQTHLAAREVYRFVGAEHRIAMDWRAGGHEHQWDDWCALLNFADTQFYAAPVQPCLTTHPFSGVAPAFSWTCP